MPSSFLSALSSFVDRSPSSATQLFEEELDEGGDDVIQPAIDTVGRPLAHLSAEKHTTGEAVYVDDMPVYKGEFIVAKR